jgi:hypothetical protein
MERFLINLKLVPNIFSPLLSGFALCIWSIALCQNVPVQSAPSTSEATSRMTLQSQASANHDQASEVTRPAPPGVGEIQDKSASVGEHTPEIQMEGAQIPKLVLEDGTPVLVRLRESLSSASVKTGDEVLFEVKDDVTVGDQVVIVRGTIASATVTVAEPKKRKGKAGRIGLALKEVPLITGEKVSLRGEESKKGRGKAGYNALEAARAGIVAPIFLPFTLFKEGEDVVVPRGETITAFLDGATTLDVRTLTAANQSLQEKRQAALKNVDYSSSMVLIYRLNEFSMSHNNAPGRRPSIYLDGAEITRLETGRFVGLRLPAGRHVFKTNDNRPVELDMAGGPQYWMRMDVTGFSSHGSLVNVDRHQALEEVFPLRSMDVKKVKLPANVEFFENVPAQ